MIFGNQTKKDIFLESVLTDYFGSNFINVLSQENIQGYENGHISKEIIQKYSKDEYPYYYICGPEKMTDSIESQISSMGVSAGYIVRERF